MTLFIKSIVLTIIAFFSAGFVVFVMYALFIYMPVYVLNKSNCLKKGYPVAQVDIFLNRYCTTIDGFITVNVDKQ